jgi:hypothetical protein
LVRWHKLTGDVRAEDRGLKLLHRVLENQSEEGWFREYQGADPGYQSLCTCYLADVHQLRPDWQLLKPLRKSIQFMWHFAHPDGSFGGLYGSRCTRLYYPAGVLALADEIPEAATLAAFMVESIASQRVVTLSSVDEPNLVPTFNAYCWAAALASKSVSKESTSLLVLPALLREPMRRNYTQAGVLIDRDEDHYSIISTSKGGVVYHFNSGTATLINAGVVVRKIGGQLGSSQGLSEVKFDGVKGVLTISSSILPMPKRCPSPWQFLFLRLMCISIFRFPKLRELVKRLLVRMLIIGGVTWPIKNNRTINLGRKLEINDVTELSSGYEIVEDVHDFVPIHMASQGYWQQQDEDLK